MHDLYKKCLFLLGILLFSSAIIWAVDDTQHWKIDYHPNNILGCSLENKSSLVKNNYCCSSIVVLNGLRSGEIPFSSSLGASFRQNTDTGQIKGIYFIADNLTLDSSPIFNLGFETSHHLIHQVLNFYQPNTILNDSARIHNRFPFKFGMDYKNSQRISPDIWIACGIYGFYHEDKNWTWGMACELKYILSKKIALRGKVTLDTHLQSSYDISISYSNHIHYNPTDFSIHNQLQSLPLERHLASFESFMPLLNNDIQASERYITVNNFLQQEFNTSIAALQQKTPYERKKYYHQLTLTLHPDKNLNDSPTERKNKEEFFKIITPLFQEASEGFLDSISINNLSDQIKKLPK